MSDYYPGCPRCKMQGVLEQVLQYLESRKGQQQGSWKLPKIDHAPGFLRYSQANAASHAHEAGCASFIGLLPSFRGCLLISHHEATACSTPFKSTCSRS